MELSQPAAQIQSRAATPSAGRWARLYGIFLDPVPTFESIARQPTWMLPLVLTLALSLLSLSLIFQVVDEQQWMRTTIENSPRGAQMTEQQLEQGMRIFDSPLGKALLYAGPALFPVLVTLAVAGLLMLMLCLRGSEARFGQILGVTTHSLFAYYFLAGTLSVLIVFLSSDPSALNLHNVICSNPGFLLDSRHSPGFYTLASGLDLLVFYGVFLLGLGLSRAAERVSLAQGIGMTLLLYGIWLGGKTALSVLW